ncbi:hypothetical protein KIN20_022425 [Parelaphostrongylus tenuis]|uniref:Uncharacterized protein n=1 Tax=Parelaphostrongylus tenuis TaxID=148309 RepID=A0AAD5QVC7_PARTN|nr:hypothetical protein KIN20_022425 [Parelaphostrongylus tenuis]
MCKMGVSSVTDRTRIPGKSEVNIGTGKWKKRNCDTTEVSERGKRFRFRIMDSRVVVSVHDKSASPHVALELCCPDYYATSTISSSHEKLLRYITDVVLQQYHTDAHCAAIRNIERETERRIYS